MYRDRPAVGPAGLAIHELVRHRVALHAAVALQPGARWRLKTDFRSHVERLMSCIDGLPFRIVGQVDDVRQNGTPWPEEDDVVTNYQQKFYNKNLPIYALWLERV